MHPAGDFLLELPLIAALGGAFVLMWSWFCYLRTKIFSASDVSQLDDLDELEVYLNTESNPQSGSEITSYSFEVNVFHCNIMNHGCIHYKKCPNINY